MSDLKSRLDRAESTTQKVNAEIDRVCRALRGLGPTAESYAYSLSLIKSTLGFSQLPSELNSIAQQVAVLKQERDEQRRWLGVAQNKLTRLEQQNRTLQAENDRLKRDLDEDEVQELKATVARLKKEKRDLTQQLQNAGSNNGRITKLEEKVRTLKGNVSLLTSEKESLQNDKSHLQKRNLDLERERDDFKEKVDIYGPKQQKPKCRGCQKRVYHLCSEFGDRWVRF